MEWLDLDDEIHLHEDKKRWKLGNRMHLQFLPNKDVMKYQPYWDNENNLHTKLRKKIASGKQTTSYLGKDFIES